MRYYETPQLNGTTEEKLEQLSEYLRGHIEDLNYNMEILNAINIWEQTLKALTSLTTENTETAGRSSQKNSSDVLRALILQCFGEVMKLKNRSGDYVSESYFLQSGYSADKTEKVEYTTKSKEDDFVSYGQLMSTVKDIEEKIESLRSAIE